MLRFNLTARHAIMVPGDPTELASLGQLLQSRDAFQRTRPVANQIAGEQIRLDAALASFLQHNIQRIQIPVHITKNQVSHQQAPSNVRADSPNIQQDNGGRRPPLQ
jgi:hypothetical protein